MLKKIITLIIAIALIGCGDNKEVSNTSKIEKINLPTLSLVNEFKNSSNQKATQAEIDSIKNSVPELPWGYYQEERSTNDVAKRRWYISTTSAKYVFSLMPIINGKAGWAGLSLDAGTIDITNNRIVVSDITSKDDCSYYDYGTQSNQEDCLVQSDIENIKNSNVPILWWFFQVNENWYIMKENSSIAYKFAGDENGHYNWKYTVDVGIKPTFFVENGIKKMKFVSTPSSEQLTCIDVSKHNGTINWNAVKNDAISCAFIKATEGYPETSYELSHQIEKNFLDAKFEENMNNALAEGLVVAPYHFIRVDYNEKISDAVKEAKHFISKIRPYYENHSLLPPVIDIENPPEEKENPNNINQIGRWTKAELTNWIKAFANEVESELGVKPILYMNESFSNSEVESSLFDTYNLWIAKYKFSSKDGTVINNLSELHAYDGNFNPNRNYLFWQFTETAVDVDGVSNFVDKNIFNGSLDDLKTLRVQSPTNNATLTSISPSGTPVKISNKTLTLYGTNLKDVAKVFIAGVDIKDFTVHDERYILIETTQRHGGNLALGVPFGYRDVIVKFNNGSRVVLKNYFSIIESTATGDYPETILQTKDIDTPYARELNAFYETSYGQDLLGQCTWYVYGRVVELVNQKFFPLQVNEDLKNAFWNKSGRDAKNWGTLLNMSNRGVSTASVPLPLNKREKGLLAVWECGIHGHVGFVEEVGGDNKEWYILSDFNRGLNTSYRKQKYKFDSSQSIVGAIDDKVGACYPTFYNLVDSSW